MGESRIAGIHVHHLLIGILLVALGGIPAILWQARTVQTSSRIQIGYDARMQPFDVFIESFLLMLVLLNPFILSVYLIDLVRELEFRVLAQHMVRATSISVVIFWVFALLGDTIFENVLRVRFSSFMIFGGITFLIIGIRLMMGLGPAMEGLRPLSTGISGAIAMPLMIGPGTISASVLAGNRLGGFQACLAILAALTLVTLAILAFKWVHDYVRQRNEALIQKYMEIAGRVTALFAGSFAIEMIMRGLEGWGVIGGLTG